MASIKIHLNTAKSNIGRTLVRLLSEEFLRDTTVRVIGGVGFALLALIWIYAIFSFAPTDYLVPLRYNSFLGVTLLGSWYQLYFVPGILLLLALLNGILASITYSRDKLVAYSLLGITVFTNICGAAVVVSLSFLVNR